MSNKRTVSAARGASGWTAKARTCACGPVADLGASAEDYLEAVYLVGRAGRPVRVTVLAGRLGVSKPSVVTALAALEERGYVRHEHYGAVELTRRGVSAAVKVYRRHRVLERFLREVLGVSEKVAATDACAVEHVLSAETVRRLEEFVEAAAGRQAGASRRRTGTKRAAMVVKGGEDAR